MEILQTIKCAVRGFEEVEVTFDLMATPANVDRFVRQMGGNGTQEGIVVKVDGWPKEEYGPDPFDGKRVPGVWLAWVSKKGWALAMKAYLEDPN
jgi:hypothetical protein